MTLATYVKSALRDAMGDVPLDAQGYVTGLGDNLLPAVELRDFKADLENGSGSEFQSRGGVPPKFFAPHSSSALAVNTFAPFRRRCEDLAVPGIGRVRALVFEKKCPNGLARATPPNLDVLLTTEDSAVAIESKLSEYLAPHRARFSDRYATVLPEALRQGPWFVEMLRLREAPGFYRHLDAAQLVKHAFGLAHTYRDRPVRLLYLFWEPTDAAGAAAFARHRAEIADFAARVDGGTPAFAHLSYTELWDSWAASAVTWVRNHAKALRARYAVALNERITP